MYALISGLYNLIFKEEIEAAFSLMSKPLTCNEALKEADFGSACLAVNF
jgi:glycerate kinase